MEAEDKSELQVEKMFKNQLYARVSVVSALSHLRLKVWDVAGDFRGRRNFFFGLKPVKFLWEIGGTFL